MVGDNIPQTRRSFLKASGAALVGTTGIGAAKSRGANQYIRGQETGSESSQFVGTWAAGMQQPTAEGDSEEGFNKQTLRQIVRTSVGGDGLRVRLANTFGTGPVTIGHATVAIRDEEGSVVSDSLEEITFGGSPSVTIPTGARVLSDTASLSVEPDQDLAVSMYVPKPTGPATWHDTAKKTSYITDGDHASNPAGSEFRTTTVHWYFLDGVDVVNPDTTGAIVTLGNSITDGSESTLDANSTYPHFLARRVNESPVQKSVLNAGIGGNRLLTDSSCCGVNALARLDRDVLSQTGVTDVILLEGINDIGFEKLTEARTAPHTSVTATELIAGMKQIISRAHENGLRIFGGTLTPFRGAAYYYPLGEQKRLSVNRWIRNSGAFDGVIDFDEALRDPDNERTLLPEYDSGDNLHPSDAGYEAMAEAVDLTMFEEP